MSRLQEDNKCQYAKDSVLISNFRFKLKDSHEQTYSPADSNNVFNLSNNNNSRTSDSDTNGLDQCKKIKVTL